jgi:hypothetical protein
MLNLLSIYAGYDSWYEFKKQHLFAGELLQENENLEEEEINELEKTVSAALELPKTEIQPKKIEIQPIENTDLQKTITENQEVNKNKIHPVKLKSQQFRLRKTSSKECMGTYHFCSNCHNRFTRI